MPDIKVTSAHLERDAYLYIRQSTARQVIENTESTLRQYALRERAVTYGWPLERNSCHRQRSGQVRRERSASRRLSVTRERGGPR